MDDILFDYPGIIFQKIVDLRVFICHNSDADKIPENDPAKKKDK
jgi:hypothetical protein